jgi:hypothetical protein
MKKTVLILFLVCIYVDTSYACGKLDCNGVIEANKEIAKQTIEQIYKQLKNKLNNDLVPAYKDYQAAIGKQNELLENVQTLKARNALLEKQILFLRAQDKELVGLSIDSTNTKRELNKP